MYPLGVSVDLCFLGTFRLINYALVSVSSLVCIIDVIECFSSFIFQATIMFSVSTILRRSESSGIERR